MTTTKQAIQWEINDEMDALGESTLIVQFDDGTEKHFALAYFDEEVRE